MHLSFELGSYYEMTSDELPFVDQGQCMAIGDTVDSQLLIIYPKHSFSKWANFISMHLQQAFWGRNV
jgi:hypothetical protein